MGRTMGDSIMAGRRRARARNVRVRFGAEKIPLYHGTARALGLAIEKRGLKPEALPPHLRSSFSLRQPGHVFFFEEVNPAIEFGCGTALKVGLGPMAQVFETDSEMVEVIRDKEQKGPRAWMHKGDVPAKLLKTHSIVDCKKTGRFASLKRLKEVGLF